MLARGRSLWKQRIPKKLLDIRHTDEFWRADQIPLVHGKIEGDQRGDQKPENKTEDKRGNKQVAGDIAAERQRPRETRRARWIDRQIIGIADCGHCLHLSRIFSGSGVYRPPPPAPEIYQLFLRGSDDLIGLPDCFRQHVGSWSAVGNRLERWCEEIAAGLGETRRNTIRDTILG